MRRSSKTRPFGFESLEKRDTPSSLSTNPGTIRGFNPQPDPPVANVNPVVIRAIIVTGGLTATTP